MSTEILQLRVWLENTQHNHIPANDNSLRLEALLRPCLGVANDAAGGDTGGDVWVVGDTPVGAFSTFSKDDIAIHKQGNWHAWSPVEGLRLVVADVRKVYDGAAWIDDPSISSGGGGSDRSTVSALATSGSVAVDFSLGDYFTLALAGNVSGFTFSGLPGAGKGGSLMIRITQDSTARTVAWPASFKWAGGVAGAVSTASGAIDVLAITTFDNGTTWFATLAKEFA